MNEYKKSYSQCGEDLIINFLLESMLNIYDVTYLDIGSNDPVNLNNTFYFYKKGFSGVCIDPNPLFKDGYKQLRPRDTFLTAGVGPKKGRVKFFEINPHTLSTFSEETARSYVEEDGHEIVKTYNVPVIVIDKIIKKYFKNSLPNFLNIDIEGWDYEILQTLDFENWRPEVVCIETITYSTKNEQVKVKKLFNLFKEHDYFPYADTFINTIFVDNRVWKNRRKNT